MRRRVEQEKNENEKIKLLATAIDKQIHQGYKLNAVNYIAYDLLNQTTIFENNYTISEKDNFLNYISSKTTKMTGEQEALKNLFL